MIFSKAEYLLFILLIVGVVVYSYLHLDMPIYYYFSEHKATYEYVGHLISKLGESQWYFIIAIFGFLFYKYFKNNEIYSQRFLFLLYANLFSGIVSIILKIIFARVRPWGLRDGNDEFGFLLFQNYDIGFFEKMQYHLETISHHYGAYTSFPSGHTVTIFTLFMYMSLIFPRYIYLWLTTAIVLSSARLLSNSHFLSDVLFGAVVGMVSTTYIYSRIEPRFSLRLQIIMRKISGKKKIATLDTLHP